MGAVVLDASVVIALLDPADALHTAAALAVSAARDDKADFVLPASVLAEVLVGAVADEDVDRVRTLVLDAFGPVRPLDERVAVAAAARRARHPGLRLPDALVLATADVDDADAVLTGDRRWPPLDERVRLVVAGGRTD
ncbi:PIN domain-containing protein [Jannaschia sp. R86511]|uniref:PIN domain-containing protein n=1 Tax=Jannaschia sp. R86511 TaxID=3093853 RepID=UPI0036D3FCB3